MRKPLGSWWPIKGIEFEESWPRGQKVCHVSWGSGGQGGQGLGSFLGES